MKSVLSLQVCENYLSAESVSDIVKLRNGAKDILRLETVVLQGLQFDLVVYEPYRCVDAIVQVLTPTILSCHLFGVSCSLQASALCLLRFASAPLSFCACHACHACNSAGMISLSCVPARVSGDRQKRAGRLENRPEQSLSGQKIQTA
jgi:hypothetical protein